MDKNHKYWPIPLSNGQTAYYETVGTADCSTAKPTVAQAQAAYNAGQLKAASELPAGTHWQSLNCTDPTPTPDPGGSSDPGPAPADLAAESNAVYLNY